MPLRVDRRIITSPQTGSYVLLIVNCAVFVACAVTANAVSFDSRAMLRWGAISNDTLANHEYWRLLAAAFLHINLLHLLINMICLMLWGGTLEKRVGTTYYLVIYLAAAIGGSVTSVVGHDTSFVDAGSSCAIFGIVGALVGLQLLGKPALPPQSLIFIIGINVVFNATQASSIDWMAHVGGFVTGVIACVALDLVERLNRVWLSCKFPEFVKLNVVTAVPPAVWLGWSELSVPADRNLPALGVGLVATMIVVAKLFDLLLGRKKGLAISVVALAAANLALTFLLTGSFAWVSMCTSSRVRLSAAAGAWGYAVTDDACAHAALVPAVLSAVVGALTLLRLALQLRRGVADVGFISEGLRADRRRATGL